jgi:alpha-glucoside transport system permease protein
MVLANLMFNWLFRGGGDSGRSAVIALIIMLAVTPIMVWNVRRANRELGGH